MNLSDQADQFFRAASGIGAPSISRRWSKWASGLFKRDKPLGSEPWFNPEAVTEQKREWLEQQKTHEATTEATWPEHIFESFYVLGLSPDMELTQVAEQLCELERKQRHHNDADTDSDHGKEHFQPPQPSFAPQVLFRYPAGSSAPISDGEVAALAFPAGVAPEKLKRTPSLSALDEIIMGRDSDAEQQCFVFMIKVAGNFPLYGCCWYVREMLHRPPYLARSRYHNCKAPFRQCMIAAPRCYCLLSRYPFFELHFRVLKIVLDLERLERLLEYDSEKSQLPPTSLGVPVVTLSTRTGRRSFTSPDPPVLAPPGAGGSSRPPSGQQQQQQQRVPMVHNRQAYCSECAGIIEDMCPFTPGPEFSLQPQSRLQRKSGQSSGTGELRPPIALDQQQQQQEQQQQQQPEQQQLLLSQPSLTLPAAETSSHCEVCGKHLGVVLPEPHSELADGAAAASAPGSIVDAVAGALANSIVLSARPSRSGPDLAAAAPPPLAGPLEAEVLNHHDHHQQQHSATGFAAAKAWAAAAGSWPTLAYTDEKARLAVQFDAIAAAVSGFDSVAATAAAPQPANSNSAATGSDRWANWQNVVEALKGVAAVPLLDSRDEPRGVPEEPGDSVDDDLQAAETSMVQRMWEAWAPKSGEQSSRTSGGLTGFLRSGRSSKSSITSLQLGAQRSGQQQQQLGGTSESSSHPDGTQQAEQQQVMGSSGSIGHLCNMQQQELQQWVANSDSCSDCMGDVLQQMGVQQEQQHNGAPAGADCMHHHHHHYHQLRQPDTEAAAARLCAAAAEASHSARGSSRGDANAEQGSAAAPQAAGDEHRTAVAAKGVSSMSDTKSSHSGMGQQPLQAGAEQLLTTNSRDNSISSFQSAEDALENERQGFDAGPAEATAAAGDGSPSQQQQFSRANSLFALHPDSREQSSSGIGQQLPGTEQQQGMQQESPTAISPFSHLHSYAHDDVNLEGLRSSSLVQQRYSGNVSSGSMLPAAAFRSHSYCSTVKREIPAQRASSAGSYSSMAAAAAAVAAGAAPQNRLVNPRCSNSAHPSEQMLIRSSSCGITDGLAWTAIACPAAPDTGAGELPFTGTAGESASSVRDVTIGGNIPASVNAADVTSLQPQNSSSRVSILPVARKSNKDLLEDVALHRSGDLSEDVCRTISHLVQADSTSLLAAYRNSPVPLPGEMYRLTLGDLYRLEFERTLPLQHYAPPGRSKLQNDVHSFAEVECAQQLQVWTVAALCRSLSLENIITMLNAALLEKQLVVFCPHIGTLAAIVLALVPMLRPFAWHSLMLPVTPDSMLAFLDAPVPFVLGVQYKTSAVAGRCHGLLRVNVYKDAIKNASFPSMPNARQLLQALAPYHTALREAAPLAVERPVHVITPDEELAAHKFLAVTHDYLSRMCGDLRLHTIVNVGMSKRTGVFMKESLIESLPAKDRTFMRAFTETMMFAAYADGVISDYCEA